MRIQMSGRRLKLYAGMLSSGEVKLVGIEGRTIVRIPVIIHGMTAASLSLPCAEQNRIIDMMLINQNTINIITPVPITAIFSRNFLKNKLSREREKI